MCGRFTLFEAAPALMKEFGVGASPALAPRYNIAPTQPVATVRISPVAGGRELVMLRWGLVPSWAKDPAIGNRLVNARAETAASKPAFRGAMRERRCLIPASGFYEWRRRNGRKQPYVVRMRDGKVFALAGLWERWKDADGGVLETCTVLTTGANETVAPIHDRMPAILPRGDFDLWLDPAVRDPKEVARLLGPFPADEMTAFPVRTLVNSPTFDGPDCIEPAPA